MEFPVNPNIYSGGAVAFNTMPFANLYLQQQAKKEAREQAANAQLSEQMKAVTPAGMRAVDIQGGFSKKLADWQKFGIENRDLLLNPAKDGYKTLNQFHAMKNELMADVELSKRVFDEEKKAAELKLSGKWIPTESDMSILEDMAKPIYDKTKKGLGLANLSPNIPALDMDKFFKTAKGDAKAAKAVVEERYDPNKGTMTVKFEERFPDESRMAMARNAGLMVSSDPIAKIHFEKVMDSEVLPQLQQVYSKYFGENEVVDSPQKAAMAYMLMNTEGPMGSSTEVKPHTTSRDRINEYRQKRAIDSQYRIQEAREKQKEDIEKAGGVQNYINDMLANKRKSWIRIGGQEKPMYELLTTPADREVFAVDEYEEKTIGQKGDERVVVRKIKAIPDKIYVSPDGKEVYPVFFEKGKDEEAEKKKKVRRVQYSKFKPVSMTTFTTRLAESLGGKRAVDNLGGIEYRFDEDYGGGDIDVSVEEKPSISDADLERMAKEYNIDLK